MKLITMGQCKAKSITGFKKQLHSGRKIIETIKPEGPVITSRSPDPKAGNCTEECCREILDVLHTPSTCITGHQWRGHTVTGGYRAGLT